VTPKLAQHVRLKYSPARDEWLLQLCDGVRDVDAIVAELAGTYEGVELSDVDGLLRDLASQRLVELT
jgi:Coenzyme PQQ synthesis protein D (PqqD)